MIKDPNMTKNTKKSLTNFILFRGLIKNKGIYTEI